MSFRGRPLSGLLFQPDDGHVSENRFLRNILNSTSESHSVLEDVQGIVTGAMLASLGVLVLKAGGLLTGGTAGLAFLLVYSTGIGFGLAFFAVNLPFYYFAWKRLGLAFTLKTFIAVGLTSVLTGIIPQFLTIGETHPLAAGLFGGALVGTALLIFFRHSASLGGFGILALFLQDRFGFKAGYVQLGLDGMVLVLSFFVATPFIIACSIAGALVINLILAFNHRRDRYIAM
ncbi:YitT family protein [Martelella lutilitoris]|uniref:YitT family protein n=1 Tax=Martelella lutilitoris TaxID=2583532 RepID=A0A5C4JU73_9HYPH|nr:YitT family protein [Martelella lutilitoris]